MLGNARNTHMLRPRALALSALVVLVNGFVACDPDDKPAPKATTPDPLAAAPCKATWPSDGFTSDGVDTRTGCMVVAMTLGSVAGAVDLSLPVALVRDEGATPSSALYPKAWFGLGTWLSVDEWVSYESTADGAQKLTLHTPNGDVVYDTMVRAPYAEHDQSDPGDDSKVGLRSWFRSRPFDGTLIRKTQTGYIVRSGNPGDTRSLTKEFEEPLPGADPKKSFDRLLSAYSKASIYRGPPNRIDVDRSYVEGNVSVTFRSSLFEGSKHTPLVVRAALPRADGEAGSMIEATTTLLHGWSSVVRAFADERGNIERVVSSGRKEGETHTTSFAYWNDETPASTVFASVVEREGTGDDSRIVKSIELVERADGKSPTWPFAVKKIVDHTRPGADRTHVVTECETTHPQSATPARATYFTFNDADGTSVATEYAEDVHKNVPIRQLDADGRTTVLQYNHPDGGGTPGQRVKETAYELKWVFVPSNMVGGDQNMVYRYDRFSIDTYGIPLVGKIAIAGSTDKLVLYRALYGKTADPFNGGRVVMSYDAPRMTAGPDGRVRMEYRGLHGFTFETVDEAGVVTKYRWLDQGQSPNGTYDEEVVDVYVMDVLQQRIKKDRFGRLLERVDHDPALGAAQPTTKYHLTADGYVDSIADTATSELFEIKAWNAPRSAITEGTLTRNGTPVRSVSATVDDFGSADGESTVTLGPITYQTTTTRGTAGVLTALAVTGPAGRRLETGLGYAPGDLSASSRTINGEPVESATPKPIAATGGCK